MIYKGSVKINTCNGEEVIIKGNKYKLISIMIKYKDFQPTSFDSSNNFIAHSDLSEYQEYFVAPCKRNRDSDLLTESNFEVQLKAFKDLNEEDSFEIHNFGHWACGWYDIVLIKPDSKVYNTALEIEDSLSDYPILSDSDYSQKEHEAVIEYWEKMSLRERIYYCNKTGTSIFAARRDACPDNVYDKLRDIIH